MKFIDVGENYGVFSNRLSISKVIIFFERKNIELNRTTIQNYVRVGILHSLIDKRYYDFSHLIIIYLSHYLKKCFTLKEIAELVTPLHKINCDDVVAYNSGMIKTINKIINSKSMNNVKEMDKIVIGLLSVHYKEIALNNKV